MTDQTPADEPADELANAIQTAIDEAVERAVSPLLWELQDLVGLFHDAADRLQEEQRRIDMMRSEMAREARKAAVPAVLP